MTTNQEDLSRDSARSAIRGVRRWLPLVVLLTVASFIGALVLLGPSESTYSSTASFELTDDVSTLINTKGRATDARRAIEAQVRLLNSSENQSFLTELLGDVGPKFLGLTVSAVEDTAIITVTATASTPGAARSAAQLAVDSYLDTRVTAEVDRQSLQLGPLREQRDAQLALIDNLSAEIEEIRATAAPSEISILEGRTADALDRLDTYNIAIQEGEFYALTADGDAALITLATVANEESSAPVLRALQVSALVLVLGLLGAHLWHRMRGPIFLVEEVTAIAGPDRPILAVIPLFRRSMRKGSNALVVQKDASSSEAEAFRYLRSSIELGLHGSNRHSIAFTSAEPAEGKSVTVANFVLSVASAGTDVVLVDADFLHPSVGPLFNRASGDDFARILMGDYEPMADPITVPTGGRPVALLTTSTATGSSRLEFTSDAVGAAVEKISSQWNVVALDCPPILRVSDATTVAAAADNAVLVVRLGKTTKQSLRSALTLLDQSGANILGIVTTHSTDRASSYGNYYYDAHAVGGGA